MSVNAAIDDLFAAMREQGIEPSGPLKMDGTLERFHVHGDRAGSTNGWCTIHLDASPAGVFGCNKRYGDHKFSWKAKQATKPMSAADLKAQRDEWARRKAEQQLAAEKRHAEAAVRAQSLWDAGAPAPDTHPYLVRKGIKAHGLRVGPWEFINAENGDIYTLTSNALYVPLCDKTRKIHSLQGIFPSKMLGKGDGARDKDYLKHGAKQGLFHAIGKPQLFDGRPVFVICEGYATGATLHEATGHLVLITFDAGNLLAVAEAIRDSKPEAIILLAADNDQWTTKPVLNPGVHFAKAAVKAVSGLLAVPPFAHSDGVADAEGKFSGPTDFNDLAVRDGNGAVADIIAAVLDASLAKAEPEPAPIDLPWDYDDAEPVAFDATGAGSSTSGAAAPPAQQPEAPKDPEAPDDEDPLAHNGYFTVLGYDHDDYFFFHHQKRQVVTCTWKEMSKKWMIMMAPSNWWEMSFPGDKGVNEAMAMEWIFAMANSRGIYDPTKIRGRGAWEDNGRIVFHHGGYLTVEGEPMRLVDIPSAYVYPMARQLPSPSESPLTDEEGEHLVGVASLVRFSMPGSAALMSGWVMLAPICGALNWRPHIWITGPAGSGKSTVQNKFCAGLTKGVNVYAQGNSTEAGIRQELKADALPVLLDEAESNTDRDKARIENIMSLIRQTSSESQAKTLKGTVTGTGQHYQIRSMFALASINVNLPTKADIDRLTKLVIKAPKPGEVGNWPELEAELNKIDADKTIASRMLARALNLMPVILKSIEVFRKAAAKHFGSQRDGDQFGTLLAGCWCLMKSYVPSELEANVLIQGYDWNEHTEDQDQDDSSKALEALLSAKIRLPGILGDQSIYELIREVSPAHSLAVVEQGLAEQTLRRHGIIVNVTTDKLLFGTGVTNLKELIARMPAITAFRDQLLRLEGAERIDKTTKFNGFPSKVISIPLSPILGEAKEAPEELPI